MRSLLTLCLFLLAVKPARAKKIVYTATDIQPALRVGADAVIRLDSTSIDITDQGFAQKRTVIITVLNEKGNKFATFSQFYDAFSSISGISGKLYDAGGKTLRSMNTNDIVDISTFGASYSFYDDNRFKYYDFNHRQYPYTVAFEYDVRYKSNFFFPSWRVQPDEKIAVEKAVCVLKHPKRVKLRQKQYNFPAQMQHEQWDKDFTQYEQWTVEAIQAFVAQPYSRKDNYYLPLLEIAVEDVDLDTFKGNFNTWSSFGDFFYRINKDKDELPQTVKDKLHKMTDTITDVRSKVAFLYKYMQENTRYVANEYGLSGWQTFEASSLAKAGYGDCKGLSNYMKAMLKAIDIPSNLVLISAGSADYYKMDRSFPINSFNHMILCVPIAPDSIWLECTSSVLPAGYLGAFTQDRDALLLAEEGGKIVRTPVYNKEHNSIERTVTIELKPGQEMQEVAWLSVYKGPQHDDLRSYLKTTSSSRTKERLRGLIPYKSAEIGEEEYTIIDADRSCPKIEERINMKVGHLLEETAKRMLVSIPMMRNQLPDLKCAVKRTEPIIIQEDLRYVYHYKIKLPQGARIESLPASLELKQPFAMYSHKVREKGGMLELDVIYEVNKGTYAPELFDAYEQMSHDMAQYIGEISITILKA